MEIVHEIFDGKVRGVAATIINAALNKTLDLHYVFTEEFSEDLDEALEYNLLDDWLYSLDYLRSIPQEETGSVDYDIVSFSGVKIAEKVIKNLLTACCADENSFLHWPENGTLGSLPKIMSVSKYLYLFGTDGVAITKKSEKKLRFEIDAHFCHVEKKDEDILVGKPGTDLMKVCDVDGTFLFENYSIYGFVAGLLSAIIEDLHNRNIYKLDLFNPDDVHKAQSLYLERAFYVENLPKNLWTTAKKIIDVYFPNAIQALSYRLSITDIDYDETEEYATRKMLEIELHQSKRLNQSRLWQMFEPEFQEMIIAYHQKFIQYLREKLGDKQQISSQNPIGASISTEQEPSARMKVLFVDANGYEDVTRKEEEKARVLRYIAEHKYGNKELDASSENPLNKMAAAFVLRWKEKKLIPNFSPTALVRFLKDDCKLECSVDDKTLSNLFGRMVKKFQKNDVYYDVCDYFN